ncbi:cell division protein SepF [Bifidobacterium castoris]|uniref:Cell division protein SepF n=1 Tax=Bifidobacterium castoris TaxID=2306972 RepID=A0A430F6L4_9BIFI|nr:cell division protein SepF [Bifidobacterium castoris]RSX47870.1 cell division protein SepF [Bifidobacterium castoris]
MPGFLKQTMSYLGMSDVAEDDDAEFDEEEDETASSFDSDRSVTPMPAATSQPAAARKPAAPFQGRVSRITTIHPHSYEDAQLVGRALRDGVPVVLNLTGVSEAVAYRIVDFSSGVVFGVSGSIERVTPRVFLLSPARVDIVAEDAEQNAAHDLFAQ